MITLKRINGKHCVTIDREVKEFATLSEALEFIFKVFKEKGESK